MTRFVDLRVDGTPVGRCVVLPGRQYTPDGPLLFFAAQVALARGWDVRQVWWDPPERGASTIDVEIAWVAGQLEAAIEGHVGRVLVVAKSLGTLAAARAAAHGYDAAWLTPLLTEPEAAGPLSTYPASQFTLIGADDPFLDRTVLDALPGVAVTVAGDHVLQVPGDPAASVASHEQFVRAFDSWLAALGQSDRS